MSSSSTADGGRSEKRAGRAWQSSFVRWLLLSLLWIALAVITAVQHATWREVEWNTALGFTLMDWGPWVVLSPIVLWFARRVQIDGHNWLRTVPLHMAGAIAITIAGHLMGQLAIDYRLVQVPGAGPPRPGEQRFDDRLPPSGTRRIPPREGRDSPVFPRFIRARLSIPIYCALVAAAHAIAYHHRSLERERRALLAEARLTEARLMALQTQLNPHFLFNALNAVSSLVYSQPRAADEMLCALSEFLRRVLAAAERREVTLGEELEFIDRYLSIQQIRFADRLDVRREISADLSRVFVPTLILQPLVENAIIHGIAPRAGRGMVTIKAAVLNDRLVLSVSDTGTGVTIPPRRTDGTVEVSEQVGLKNTHARLAAMYGDDAHFTLTPAPEGGLCARIDLTLRHTSTA